MPNKIFDLTDLNDAGICHAISCKWVRESIRRNGVTSEADLGSRLAMFIQYEQPDDMDGIVTAYHLNIDEHIGFSSLDRNPIQIAEKLTRGKLGYFLLGVGSFKLGGREGHTMAARRVAGQPPEFFDPNEGAWSFTNSLDFYTFLPGFLTTNYGDLLGKSCDIWRVS